MADFSTTGQVERAATEIVLLDAMRSYFHYRVRGLCGIPRITLLGTAADFRRIRARVENLLEYGIDDWAKLLLPVVDQMVAAAEGAPRADFWRSMYRSADWSGGPREINGWCNVLFPYLDMAGQSWPNDFFAFLLRAQAELGDAWWTRAARPFADGYEDDEDAPSAAPPWLELFLPACRRPRSPGRAWTKHLRWSSSEGSSA